MKCKHIVTILRKSCLTGKVVWIYRGPSKNAARVAYHRACKHELERMKHWSERVARRMTNIARLLSDCMSEIPINADLTPEQKEAAKQLLKLSKENADCHREFYEHVVEERRRRKEADAIRQEMRRRKKSLQ